MVQRILFGAISLVLTFTVLFIACTTKGSRYAGNTTVADDDNNDDDAVYVDDTSDDTAVIDDDSHQFADDDTPLFDPGDPGAYAIADVQMFYPDPSSGRDEDVRVFFPSKNGVTINVDDGPRPVILFGPGFSAPKEIYFSYGRHLASWGFMTVMRDNTVVSQAALAVTTRAILDWLVVQAGTPGGFFYAKLDFHHIGTSGHSMGGKISLLTASEDVRITASATIDPVDASPLPGPSFPSVTPELMPGIHIPTMFIGSETGGTCAPAAQNYHQYYLYANLPSTEIMIRNSGHLSFTDLSDAIINAASVICPSGGGDNEQTRRLARRYLTAFYLVYFNGLDEYRYYFTGDGIDHDVIDGLVTTESK